MRGRVVNLLNRRFSKIVVKEFLGIENHYAMWRCECDCGRIIRRRGCNLNAGHHKSCGCSNGRLRPYESLYNNLIYVAGRRGHSISLTYEDFVNFTHIKECHYCEKPILWKIWCGQKTLRHNLDRKDNSIGYSLDNCVVCCHSCNVTKGDRFTYEEFMLFAPILKTIQRRRDYEKSREEAKADAEG